MADTRYFIIHKEDKYDRFIQVGFDNAGIAMGQLTSIGAKNLYLYLVANKNGKDDFELKVANYANWLGDPVYDEKGNKIDSKHATYRNQINTGIKQMLEKGYLVEKYKNSGVYDFYEMGTLEQIISNEINSNKSNNLSSLEQIVSEKTNVVDIDKVLQPKVKIVYKNN